jgi:dolichol-phosphate mannosyltransferase
MTPRPPTPDVSLVMPCFNEQEALPATARALLDAFAAAGVALELVLVDNGSTDGTRAVIQGLVAAGRPVTPVLHDVNQGYGGGILSGLRACAAERIGYLCADGQVSAEDTLMVYRLLLGRENRVIAKVRRRFRQDSWKRKVISITYNGMMQALYGGLGAIDLNGSPKLFSREVFQRMELRSSDWFLDPELMVKAHYLGLRMIEIDVEGYARQGGASNVKLDTVMEFLGNIARYRMGHSLDEWRERTVPIVHAGVPPSPPSPPPAPLVWPAVDGPLPGVQIVTQQRHSDSRGWLHKVLATSQSRCDLGSGEVYVTSAKAGEFKGGHLHRCMGEWFAVVQGNGALQLADPATGEEAEIELRAVRPRTVYVPPGIAHALVNTGRQTLICVAWAEGEHDPEDVFPHDLA